MAFAAKTRTTVRLVWRASTDDVGVAGYRLYRNGVRVATVRVLQYTFTGLRCATRYTFALEAVDAAATPPTAPRRPARSQRPRAAVPPCRSRRYRSRRHRSAQPRAREGQLWVDPDGGSVAARSRDRLRECTACRSLQAAYNAARSGDTINIADGTYGGQGLGPGAKKLVVPRRRPGRPSFGQIVSAAANITVRGILIQDRDNLNGPCTDPDNAVLYPAAPTRPSTTSSSTA